MGSRIESDVSSGKAARKGAEVQVAGDKPMLDPHSSFLDGHVPADFAAVVGGGKVGGSQSAAAPDGGRGGGNIPAAASTPLQGHTFASTNPSRGNFAQARPRPQDPAGRHRQAQDCGGVKHG
jgi:hypothetical protein